MGALLFYVVLASWGWWLLARSETKELPPRMAGPMTCRELAGLIEIDYDQDLILVSPRGVELPYCELWTLDDVVETLVEVDAL